MFPGRLARGGGKQDRDEMKPRKDIWPAGPAEGSSTTLKGKLCLRAAAKELGFPTPSPTCHWLRATSE